MAVISIIWRILLMIWPIPGAVALIWWIGA
jgi:hypothetical protein